VKNNITIAYVLTFAKNTWFWLGIWIFYYLRFTNYAGIGLIETVLIVTTTLTEIPTGAVADLLGKKKTLVIAFLLEAVGAYMMAFALIIMLFCGQFL
jgi:MFS family permease